MTPEEKLAEYFKRRDVLLTNIKTQFGPNPDDETLFAVVFSMLIQSEVAIELLEERIRQLEVQASFP